MDQKIKFLVIGVCGIALVFLFLFVQIFLSKQAITRERNDLKKENVTLTGKLDKLESSIRDYDNKLATAKRDLETAAQQKSELEKNLTQAISERNELTNRLKRTVSNPAPVAIQPQPQEVAPPPTADEYWAGIIKDKTALGLQLEDMRKNFNTLQLANEQLQKEKANLELEVKNYKRERSDLTRQLEYNRKMMDSVATELVRERNDRTKIQDNYKTLKQENITLMRQLNSLNGRKVTLDRKIENLQSHNDGLERRINEMETMLIENTGSSSVLKGQIDAIRQSKAATQEDKGKESVELPPIVVRPASTVPEPAAVTSSSAFEGKIVAVNRENNFVIVDLGDRAGLKAGDTLQAYRQGKIIALLEVTQTRNDISACDIKQEAIPLQIGDIIK
ncbi:MAG: hypothetical protein ABSB18_00525 [Candidatus Omnitrophota bacterium]